MNKLMFVTMKKSIMKGIKIYALLLASLFIFSGSIAQTLDCGSFCVKAVEFDTVTSAPFKMVNVTVKNNGQNSISYFTVYSVINANGDTIAKGPSTHFILFASDSSIFDLPALVNSFPPNFTGKIVVGVLNQDTCILDFPCEPAGVPIIHQPPIRIYPVPAEETVTVHQNNAYQSGTIQLLNINGQIIQNELITSEKSNLQVGHLPRGMYFLRIHYGEQRIVRKLILGSE